MKSISIKFGREELIYDITNLAYVEGDILPEDAQYIRNQIIEINEKGNRDRVSRVLNMAYAVLDQILSTFTKQAVVDGAALDNQLTEPAEYVFNMNVPDAFTEQGHKLLQELINEYFVAAVLYDWLKIHNPKSAEKWRIRLEELTILIKTAMNARGGITRRKMSPF